ncbi:MAG: SusC/RagA family TonB-linked outer membrane protein [Prevotella sp.]|nr:SusC/RagA family TonB-linked outer membrane protein [Prevotella sp.]MBR0275642.1 SusC/RagA family TonB-linked outer membrane protein [Prevotella sp.]
MTIKKAFTTALLCAAVQLAMAQGIRISGTLSDADGPIMMGNVTERDANNRIVSATQTDFNGNFSMQVKSTKNKLVFSYVGDKEKVITIGNQTNFKVKLDPANTQLKEVKVVGRRTNSGGLTIQKKEMTVSSQTMSMEQVEGLAFTSADEALQGEIAGLDIVSNSGNLGAGTQMRLRGVTTLSANANPLIVVDDKIFDNPDENFDYANADEEQYSSLLSVNVEDIASITVLKDAAATAVWGSRGSNGVIMITTKRGSRGKPKINFSYKFTGTWQPEGYNLLNGDDYTMLMKEEFYNPTQRSDRTTNIAELNYDKSWAEYENWNNNTDWVDAVKQFGAMHDFNVNLTGGGQKATFRISAGYKHQSGSIIKQKFQQFTTRMALDYNVSDRIRFLTNFALTYTNNNKNNEKKGSILSIAQRIAPNMAIYRQNADGSDTGEYYLMNPSASGKTPYDGDYSSVDLASVRNLGNPVAIAHQAWVKDQTYRLTPDFTIKYEILGTEAEKSRLTFNGRVDFDIFAESKPTYWPAALSTDNWTTADYNSTTNYEYNSMKIGGRTELVFTPYFKNRDWTATMLLRYEMSTSKNSKQDTYMSHLPNNITSPTVDAYVNASPSSGNGRSNSQNILYNGHVSYKDGRYSLGFSLRADGDSKFGPKNKWAYFPGVSVRYNIIDEPFMKWSRSVVSMLGLRASWGINGKAPDKDYLFYNTYNTSAGNYGKGNDVASFATLDGLKLDDLRWEKTTSYNLGANLGLWNDKIEVDFDYYHKNTTDLLQGITIPSMAGYSSIAYANVGRMTNDGWEMNFTAKKFLKIGKFSADFSINVAQNSNLLKSMDESVLQSINGTTWDATRRGNATKPYGYPVRVQINNSLGSIYGFRYQGVYNMTYDYLQNYQTEQGLNASEYEDWVNGLISGTLPDQWYADHNLDKRPYTAPVAVGDDGKVLMKNNGEPQRMVYDYQDGKPRYEFQGGDAKYEDINHDGQINGLDVVYLGNSLPKVNGGFSLTLRYGQWSVKARFNYRFGNKVVNLARMNLESMYNTDNQSATVNYRWRKDGDQTPMPRAMYNAGWNFQSSDRYVEDGGFVRFQNLQVAYNFDRKLIKKWGLSNLQAYASFNNLYVWTKYSGTDPEVSAAGYYPAFDTARTPRSKQFTLTLNVGF